MKRGTEAVQLYWQHDEALEGSTQHNEDEGLEEGHEDVVLAA